MAQWAHYNRFVREWVGYWLLNELKLITMSKNANEMTRITKLWRKKDPQSGSRSVCFIYVYYFLFLTSIYVLCYQAFLSLFSSIPYIRIFIFLLYLHIDYPSHTPGELRLYSQVFCLIRNILVNFCLAIWAVPWLFIVISSLMWINE